MKPIMFRKLFYLIILTFLFIEPSKGQATANLENNILTLSNSLLERKFLWNEGELIPLTLLNKENGKNLVFPEEKELNDHDNKLEANTFINNIPPPVGSLLVQKRFIPSQPIYAKQKPLNASFEENYVPENSMHVAYVEAIILVQYEAFDIKRVFRIYDNVPAIASDNYIFIHSEKDISGLLKNLENPILLDKHNFTPRHLKLKAIEFFDRTDVNNNLVKTDEVYSFVRIQSLRGNILKITDPANDSFGAFIIKEAPCSFVQLDYPGHDFSVINNEVSVEGIGLPSENLIKDEWVNLYGSVIGVFDGSDLGFMRNMRSYQMSLRKFIPERDEMIMMNTWGDRHRDTLISEEFLITQVDACKRLGVSHLQIDDGWQQGLSINSGDPTKQIKGKNWNSWSPELWEPNKERLPNGLDPVVNYAKEKGVKIGLWINPSNFNSYINWENDANIILDYYKRYDIRYFKIDAIKLFDKLADHRLGMFFEKINKESNGEIVINLDATADNRTGYHYKNIYGNIFLENRYTDWVNYYPHWTLRNLWQLSAYVPSKGLQIEFLNKWRNPELYNNDPLAPSNYSFEYVFAVTMMAQPLAWMECSGLPEEAFEMAPMIEKYNLVKSRIHSGHVLPIGNEPNGHSWTGFQSISDDNSGFLLFFREKNNIDNHLINTYLPVNSKIQMNLIIGNGKSARQETNSNSELMISLPDEMSFGLYEYKIISE